MPARLPARRGCRRSGQQPASSSARSTTAQKIGVLMQIQQLSAGLKRGCLCAHIFIPVQNVDPSADKRARVHLASLWRKKRHPSTVVGIFHSCHTPPAGPNASQATEKPPQSLIKPGIFCLGPRICEKASAGHSLHFLPLLLGIKVAS